MRRKGWILSMLGAAGLGFGQLQADDPFAAPNESKKAEPRSSLYFAPGRPDAAKTPARYQRGTATPAPAAAPASADAGAAADPDLKNYYKDLFGGGPETAAPVSSPRSAGVPFGPASPGTVGQPAAAMTPTAAISNPGGASNSVIQAKLESVAGSGAGTGIEQVAGQDGGARPFPGLAPQAQPVRQRELPTLDFNAPLPDAAPVTAPAVPAAPPAGPAAAMPAMPMGQPRPSANALTNPIPTAPVLPRPAAAPSAARTTPVPQTSIVPVAHSESLRTQANAAPAPMISLHWSNQGGVNVGQECSCMLTIRNTGKLAAEEVEVEAFFPSTVRLIDAAPRPAIADSYLGWEFDSLEPGSEQVITIKMIPLQRGDINADAQVRFSARSSSTFSVSEPMLALAVEGSTEVMIGEPVGQKIVVSNPGTGIASNVRLLAQIPAGLKHSGGERIEMLIGSLNPGESRPVSLPLIAVAGGRHLIEVQARGDAGLNRTAGTEVAVIAPSLKAAIMGPGLRYVGRSATYTVTVVNDGAAATDNVRVMYKIPEGLTFVNSDKGTQFDAATRMLSWFVGRMDLGATSQLNVTLKADQIGTFAHLVQASSEYGTVSNAQLSTTVEGTSSLSLQVADLDDPVEIGTEAAYEIRVKNEGSAAAKMVALVCELPTGSTFLRCSGPTRHGAQGDTVQFEPLPELGPGELATYTVFVSTSRPGSLRFKTRLVSESISEPLVSEELTKFYGE